MQKSLIILHHSLTKDRETVSWGAIRKYHFLTLGWKNIGYAFGVELLGDSHEILFGRFPEERGAHCKNAMMNERGIGICVVGNFDVKVPTVGAWETTKKLVRWLMLKYSISSSAVIGHREAQAMDNVPLKQRKTCPGIMFNMEKFRMELSA